MSHAFLETCGVRAPAVASSSDAALSISRVKAVERLRLGHIWNSCSVAREVRDQRR
jgi:hypothetical protein